MVYVSFVGEKKSDMRLWRRFKLRCAAVRQIDPIMEDFERLCAKMMEDPAYGKGIRLELDNEFYARFGMSADEVSAQLSARNSGVYNQKPGPIY